MAPNGTGNYQANIKESYFPDVETVAGIFVCHETVIDFCTEISKMDERRTSKCFQKLDQRMLVLIRQIGPKIVAPVEHEVRALADFQKVGDKILHYLL